MLTYALISSKADDVKTVYKDIKNLGKDSVRRICKTYGAYDVLAEVKADDGKKMKEILSSIQDLEGVINMKTLTVVHKTRADDQIPKFLLSR